MAFLDGNQVKPSASLCNMLLHADELAEHSVVLLPQCPHDLQSDVNVLWCRKVWRILTDEHLCFVCLEEPQSCHNIWCATAFVILDVLTFAALTVGLALPTC